MLEAPVGQAPLLIRNDTPRCGRARRLNLLHRLTPVRLDERARVLVLLHH